MQRGLELRMQDLRRPGGAPRTFGEPGQAPLRERHAPADQGRRILHGLLFGLQFRRRTLRRAGAVQVRDARHVPRRRTAGRRGAHRGPRRHRHQTAGQGSRHFQHGTRGGVCGLRRRQHQPHRSSLLDRRLPARAPAAGQLPQYAQHAGDVQEIRHETPLEGVRGVEGRPGRAAQRDDEVFPGAGELFDGRFFGEGDPPAGGRGELHALPPGVRTGPRHPHRGRIRHLRIGGQKTGPFLQERHQARPQLPHLRPRQPQPAGAGRGREGQVLQSLLRRGGVGLPEHAAQYQTEQHEEQRPVAQPEVMTPSGFFTQQRHQPEDAPAAEHQQQQEFEREIARQDARPQQQKKSRAEEQVH